MPITHGTGVRTDYPKLVTPKETKPKAPEQKSAMVTTYEAASRKNALQDVSASKAKSLEAQFKGGKAKTENLRPGGVGASVQGMVVNGELFVRTKVVRPGTTPTWKSAGKLVEPSTPKDVKKNEGWGPKPQKLEARVQKTVADRMNLMTPAFELKGSELAAVKKGIANGEFQVVNASPKGLAGVGMTGYVADNMLIVEKHVVRPGAKPTFYMMGPLE